MKKYIIFMALIIALSFTCNLLAKIVVESTKGEAAYKRGRQWVPLKKGMVLNEGTKISTGIKSWALIDIDGDSLKVQQLTMMKIYRNKTTSNEKNTHIGLKHGSLRARIKKIGTLKTSFKITTPVATSSVRGTEEIDTYGSKSGMTIEVIEGIVEGENPYGILSYIQGNLFFRLRPDEPRPENLLLNEKNKSFVQIFDPNSTDDEKNYYEYWLDTSGNDNPGIFVPSSQSIGQGTGSTSVNLQLDWGGE